MPKLPPPPILATCTTFLDVKNDVLARITEPSNDDYDNGVSDNCDQNFGTFDDFGVKNDQKVSHNMILMSKYKGQHGGKTGSKNSGRGLPPPFSGNAQKKTFFFSGGLPLQGSSLQVEILPICLSVHCCHTLGGKGTDTAECNLKHNNHQHFCYHDDACTRFRVNQEYL